MPEPARRAPDAQPFYLPDFCAARMVLTVVLIAELVALVLVTGRLGLGAGFWVDLARTSLFLLWIALGGSGALCYLRPALARLGVRRGSAAALGLLLAITALVSEAAWRNSTTDLGFSVLNESLAGRSHGGFVLGNLAVCLIVSGIMLRYFYIAHQWRRNVEAESRSRIEALQARIRPHFLYNSMNTIAALTRSNAELAERAVEDLADLFRASLSETRNVVRLADELEIARTYERIEALRLGARLAVDWRVATLPPDTLVPSMCLQPLLENAIYHGIERLPAGGAVRIDGRMDGDQVEIAVDNPLPPATLPAGRAGNRVALANIRERLDLIYGGTATLTTEEPAGRFVARLRFPARGPALPS